MPFYVLSCRQVWAEYQATGWEPTDQTLKLALDLCAGVRDWRLAHAILDYQKTFLGPKPLCRSRWGREERFHENPDPDALPFYQPLRRHENVNSDRRFKGAFDTDGKERGIPSTEDGDTERAPWIEREEETEYTANSLLFQRRVQQQKKK